MTPAARVTIVRTDAEDVGHRQIIVRIDGDASRTLMFGETMTQEVAPGEHRLRAHNTLFWKTVPFTLAPGEHIEFTVINRSGRFSFGALALVGAAPLYLTIRSRKIGAGSVGGAQSTS